MATLTLTFTRAFTNVITDQLGGLAVGAAARSEVLTLPATSTLEAQPGENAVELVVSDSCWVAIGEMPEVDANSDGLRQARFLVAGIPYQYYVETGDKVAAEV